MIKKIFSLIFLVIVSISALFSQDSIMNISISDACKYAIENNKMMKNASLDVRKSQMVLREAISGGLPQINANADYSNFLGAEMSFKFSENMPEQKIKFKPQSNFSLNVTQLIFSGQYWVGLQTAKLAKKLTETNREKSELDIVSQTSETYHLVLISEALLERMNTNTKNLKSLLEKTRPLVKVGIMEQTDLDQLEVQLNTLFNAVKSLERQLEMANNMLRLQLGTDPTAKLKLTTKLDELISADDLQNTLNTEFNVQNTVEMQLVNQQAEISKKMVNLQRASVLPTLAAFYNYNHKILKPDFDMSPKNVVGLKLNIPIFAGFNRSAKINQAKIDFEKAKNTQEFVNEQLTIQEKQLKFNYKNAFETYENQKRNVEISRKVYDNLKKKYEQGLLSGLDLINADNNYVKAETDLISATMKLLSAKTQLKKLYKRIKN